MITVQVKDGSQIREIQVNEEENVQNLRQTLSNQRKVNLAFYKTKAVRKDGPTVRMEIPEAPHLLLISDASYSLKEIIRDIPTTWSEEETFIKKFFDLVFLDLVLIETKIEN